MYTVKQDRKTVNREDLKGGSHASLEKFRRTMKNTAKVVHTPIENQIVSL
jgi:hypothetical protein